MKTSTESGDQLGSARAVNTAAQGTSRGSYDAIKIEEISSTTERKEG
jgi:hypothetical protein